MADRRVHLVDDDDAVRDALGFFFQVSGYDVTMYENAQLFLDDGRARDTDCLVTDMHMPGVSGLELAERLRESGAGIPIVMITGHAELPQVIRAIRSGACDVIQKPFDERTLLGSVERAFVPKMDDLRRLAERFDRLSATEWRVLHGLLSGETKPDLADALDLTHRDIDLHIADIIEKTASGNIIDLAKRAVTAMAARPGGRFVAAHED